jgi:hypothetical protein
MRVSQAVQTDAGILFVSAKTKTSIPTSCVLVRDALIQGTLDPGVRAIERYAQAGGLTAPVVVPAIVIVRDDGRFYLDVDGVHHGPDWVKTMAVLKKEGLMPLALTATDINREPHLTNARLVWHCRMHPVGITVRMSVLQILADDGPMTLSQLLSSIRSDRDPSPAILAMACSDLIELDLMRIPLGPKTVVRARA